MSKINSYSENKLFYKHDRIVRAAWKYYKEELNQTEIAESMGISRFKVMDMLTKAKEEGIVQVKINSPVSNCLSLEHQLKENFALKDAFVLPAPQNKEDVKKVIGYAGGDYLENKLSSGDLVGTAWGETLFEVSQNFYVDKQEFTDISFVLMLGGLTGGENALSLNPYDVAKTLADQVGGNCYYIFSPAVVDSKTAKKTLLADKRISSALDKACSVNKALIGIGETTAQATLVQTGFLTEEEMEELIAKGAVGDIAGRFFDIEGRPIDSAINDLIIGLDLADISAIDEVIGFAGGESKVESIYGALKGEYLDSLVTDEETAKKILAKEEEK